MFVDNEFSKLYTDNNFADLCKKIKLKTYKSTDTTDKRRALMRSMSYIIKRELNKPKENVSLPSINIADVKF